MQLSQLFSSNIYILDTTTRKFIAILSENIGTIKHSRDYSLCLLLELRIPLRNLQILNHCVFCRIVAG